MSNLIATLTNNTGLSGSLTSTSDLSGCLSIAYSHSLLSNLDSDDHLQYHTNARGDLRYDLLGTASGLVSTHELTYNHVNYNTAYVHSQLALGNPHSVTYAELGGTQPEIYWTRTGTVLDTKTAGDQVRIGQTSGGYLDFTGSIDIRDDGLRKMAIIGSNIRIGAYAGNDSMIGGNNTLIGAYAGQNLSSVSNGNANVFIGDYAGQGHTTARYNVGLGMRALQVVGAGGSNIAIGFYSFYKIVDKSYNVGLGAFAGAKNYGIGNTFVGYMAGANYGAADPTVNVSNYNFGFGHESLYYLSTGHYNIAMGYGSGKNVNSGGYNLMLGRNVGLNYTNESYNILIGDMMQGTVADSYHIRIGVADRSVIEGNAASGSEWMGTAYEIRTDKLKEYGTGNGVTISNQVNMPNLPVAAAGLVAGDLWNNGGVINIV